MSRLNRAPGVPLQVSTETLDLLLACDAWHEQTEGAFSVMVGGALTAYGYRESQRVRPPRTSRTPKPVPIDRGARRRRRRAAPGVRAGGHLARPGRRGAHVERRARRRDRAHALRRSRRSCSRSATTWWPSAAITSSPWATAPATAPHAVVLRDGHALASSSWSALLWSNDDGATAHHLIDPATGAPAEPASAVVIASDAGEADALATALAVRPSLVAKLTTTCAMVQADQGERHTAAWESVAV